VQRGYGQPCSLYMDSQKAQTDIYFRHCCYDSGPNSSSICLKHSYELLRVQNDHANSLAFSRLMKPGDDVTCGISRESWVVEQARMLFDWDALRIKLTMQMHHVVKFARQAHGRTFQNIVLSFETTLPQASAPKL